MGNIFLRKMKMSFDRIFPILTTTVTILSIVIVSTVLYTQMKDSISFYKTKDDGYEKFIDKVKIKLLQEEIDMVKMQKDSLITSLFTLKTDSTKSIDKIQKINELRFIQIESNLERQSEITTALRQAINPLNPDEVLTIARLKDGISDINKRISELENNINVRQQYFEDSIKREMASSNNSTTLILVVLIPLVLNFLYTLWKDYRKPDKEKSETK